MLNIDDSVLRFAEKQGYLVLGVGSEVMEIKSSKDFTPKRWHIEKMK